MNANPANQEQTTTPPQRTPPPPPPCGAGTNRPPRPRCDERRARFGGGYGPFPQPVTAVSAVDALLKLPGRLTFEIVQGKAARTVFTLLGIAAFCLLLYGFVMGSFSGGGQLWLAPAKVLSGALASAVICLPSLYILTSLAGGTQSLSQTTGLLLQALALNSMLLLGFAPIAWIFSQATETTVFMGWMHLMIWGVGLGFSLSMLKNAFGFLNERPMGMAVTFWGAIFFLVLVQMSTTLRPLIGAEDGFFTPGKKFFLQHWGDCIRHPKP